MLKDSMRIGLVILITQFCFMQCLHAQQRRINLKPSMLQNESGIGDASKLIDEQDQIIGPPVGKPDQSWKIGGQHYKNFPLHITLDLKTQRNISDLWLFDTNGKGDVVISSKVHEKWVEMQTYNCGLYQKWVRISLDTQTRYLRLTRQSPSANFSEIAIYEHTAHAWEALQKELAFKAKIEKQRQAKIDAAMLEMKKRPLVDLGEPFGKAYLVDEVDCSKPVSSDREFYEYPKGISSVQNILGRDVRVIAPVKNTASYISYRMGKMKLLQPGQAYVLVVEYPEDQPRTIIVSNTGNESIRGFHTGPTVGDALHAKYVNSLCESIDTPLSGKWETWTQLFRLHDRFTEHDKLPRGSKVRSLIPEDGFPVTLCQFSAKNSPHSKGIAVSKIKLYAIADANKLVLKINYPDKSLPRRRIFWREEMSDGVIGAGKNRPQNTLGITHYIDWYRNKAKRMQFLGINTFSKDLLEFGANQGWDPTEHGGNQWVYFNAAMKNAWQDIVKLMGEYDFDLLPYYEYSGSKGQKGLGFEKRAKPLKRTDGNYTHIKWIESAKADLTDPDTFEDFRKMLELTVIRHQNKANFAGIWLRPRNQLPIGFADNTIVRFIKDTKPKEKVTRDLLAKNKQIYNRYIQWWQGKRKDFLVQIRDYLQSNGIENPTVLFTNNAGEPGVGFGDWTPRIVTDNPDIWEPIVKQKVHQSRNQNMQIITPLEIAKQGLYLKALQLPGLSWGDYEIHHAQPASDPANYANLQGVMLSMAFNRVYTVNSPQLFKTFSTPSGLAIMRHHALNEHMMFDENNKQFMGYFVADMEKAGPYCMMSQAIAMANGDPTMLGTLTGGNYVCGFAKYVRRFNANFLALPALPSTVMPNASTNKKIVVRKIDAGKHGTYIYAVNNSMAPTQATVTFPNAKKITVCETGEFLKRNSSQIIKLYPYQLISWHVQ